MNKRRLIKRIIELLIIVITIVVTAYLIKYTTIARGYSAIGGEYMLPVMAVIVITLLEN